MKNKKKSNKQQTIKKTNKHLLSKNDNRLSFFRNEPYNGGLKMEIEEYQKELENLANEFNDGDLSFVELERLKKELRKSLQEG